MALRKISQFEAGQYKYGRNFYLNKKFRMLTVYKYGDAYVNESKSAIQQQMTLLANILQKIFHRVLPIAGVKISRYCININFSEDYFRQQNQQMDKKQRSSYNSITVNA